MSLSNITYHAFEDLDIPTKMKFRYRLKANANVTNPQMEYCAKPETFELLAIQKFGI